MRRPRGAGSTVSACQQCSESFNHPARFAQKYCSRECKNVAQTTGATNWLGTFSCAVCGQEFRAARTLNRKTCSKACQYKYFSITQRDPSNTITALCPQCTLEFNYYASWPRTFCSSACSGKARISNIKRFAPSIFTVACESCGRPFQTTPARTRGRFCSRRCYGDWLSINSTGEANPRYLGGTEPYYGGSWKSARRMTRLRDVVCQDCNITPVQLGKELDVHHIMPFKTFGRARHKEANALSNLVSLCPVCHIKREWATNWGPFKARAEAIHTA